MYLCNEHKAKKRAIFCDVQLVWIQRFFFPFPKLGSIPRLKKTVGLAIYPYPMGRIVGSIPSPRKLETICEMQIGLPMILIRVTDYISFDDNRYTTGASYVELDCTQQSTFYKNDWNYCWNGTKASGLLTNI